MRTKLFILFTLFLIIATQAVGPKWGKRILSWTPSPSYGVTGYYLYWRTTNSVFVDTQRFGITTNTTTFDLVTLNLPPEIYSLAMSATNAAGNESGLSMEAVWDATLPEKPGNIKIQ